MYFFINLSKKKIKNDWFEEPGFFLKRKRLIGFFKKYSKKFLYYIKKMNYMNIKPIHYFNDILYTRWPFYIGLNIFLLLFFFIMLLKQINIAYNAIFICFFSFLWMLGGWFYDMIIESVIYGKYSKKLRQGINYGFILFLISEAFLFLGFFREFFDRIFDPLVSSGSNSLIFGIEPLYKSIKPIFATFILICSGFLINLSSLSIKYSWMRALQFAFLSIILGFIFLYIQYMEYTTLLFVINDNIFCSLFYLLTGFHGFHVIIGLLFLLIQKHRLNYCHFNRFRYQGFILGGMYWHFVDYIWIFLFFSIYFLNWALTYYYLNYNILNIYYNLIDFDLKNIDINENLFFSSDDKKNDLSNKEDISDEDKSVTLTTDEVAILAICVMFFYAIAIGYCG